MFEFWFCFGHHIGHIVTVVPPQLDRDIFVNRAGVRFLLSDTEFREKLQDFVGLYFQLPSQLVNANLSHKNSSLRHKDRQVKLVAATLFQGVLWSRAFRMIVSRGTRVFYPIKLFKLFRFRFFT